MTNINISFLRGKQNEYQTSLETKNWDPELD